MNHVTDERTDRPLDRHLHDWLDGSIEELPDGAELPSAIRSDVLSRLPGTPQRRRWWPFRWFPFGLGATRSADREGPHREGRSRSMFNAARVAVVVTALALTSSLAYVAVTNPQGATPVPGAAMDDIDPADFGGFSGTMKCDEGELGTVTTLEWGTLNEGETYTECLMETDDPRISGNNHSIHNYYKYDGYPMWGVRNAASVITNDEGTWVSDRLVGYQEPWNSDLTYAGEYHGTGAYEGLTAILFLTQESFGLDFDAQGVIIPGELPEAPDPPIEAGLAVD